MVSSALASSTLICQSLATFACTAYIKCMQYTIRNVPVHLDEVLRVCQREDFDA